MQCDPLLPALFPCPRPRGLISVDARLDHVTEVADEALHRPGCRVTESADSVPLYLLAHFEQEVNLALLGLAPGHALQDPPHPARTLTAWCALAAAFVLEEIGDARHRLDD